MTGAHVDDHIVRLEQGEAACLLAARLGGSITHLRIGDLDLLRSVPDATAVTSTASFPLLPFGNRIRNGRFALAGREICLPAGPGAPPHAHHGHGWRAAWEIVEAHKAEALLRYDHAAGAWPWSYHAHQHFRLDPSGLHIAIVLDNVSDTAMPVGVGIHPYFPRAADSRIAADACEMWHNTADGVATDRVTDHRLAHQRPVAVSELEGADNFFVAARGEVRIWSLGREIIVGSPEATGFQLYVPPGADFFCVEPVSHAPDSFNRPPLAEADLLGPGQTRTWHFAIRLA